MIFLPDYVFSMNNHIPISDRTFEFAVRISKLCSYLDKQPGTPLLCETLRVACFPAGVRGSQKYQFKSQN